MTENKRYSEQNLENHLNRIYDNHECKVIFDKDIVDLLNDQDTTIKRLKTIREEQIQTILKQKSKIKELEEENKQLKAQLEKGGDVCGICKHEYIIPSNKYYIAKCKKGHDECSKSDVDYCKDFELKDGSDVE